MNDEDDDRSDPRRLTRRMDPRSVRGASPSLPRVEKRGTGIMQRIDNYNKEKLINSEIRVIRAGINHVSAMEDAVKATLSYGYAVTELEEFDKERVRRQIRTHNEIDDLQLDKKLMQKREEHRLEAERIERSRNPPPKQEPRDKFAEEISDILHGGGKSKRTVDEAVAAFIRECGGESNLTQEQRDRIRNAYQRAAENDLSKGRR